jgi:hypothetical protein
MVTEPKPKAVRKKKTRRRKPPEEFVDYVGGDRKLGLELLAGAQHAAGSARSLP